MSVILVALEWSSRIPSLLAVHKTCSKKVRTWYDRQTWFKGGHRETVLGCDGQNPNLKELLRMWVFQLITMDVTDMRVAPAPP